jgi:hypothetical protein
LKIGGRGAILYCLTKHLRVARRDTLDMLKTDCILLLYFDSMETRNPLAKRGGWNSAAPMIRRRRLDGESRQNLIELARDGSAAHCPGRRANAFVLLDDGMSCEAVAKVLLLDTTRTWYRLYEEDGIEGQRASATRAAPAS